MRAPPANPLISRFELKERQIASTSQAYRRSPKQEAELAKRYKGRKISRSGAGPRKGDTTNKVVRIEAKTTSKDSFRVTKKMIEVINNAAIAMDEIPCIVVEFLDENGKPEMEVAVIPTSYLDIIGDGTNNDTSAPETVARDGDKRSSG